MHQAEVIIDCKDILDSQYDNYAM